LCTGHSLGMTVDVMMREIGAVLAVDPGHDTATRGEAADRVDLSPDRQERCVAVGRAAGFVVVRQCAELPSD